MKVILLACMILCWVKPQKEQKIIVEKASAYESFYKAGTSKLLLNIFECPKKYGVEKASIDMEKEEIVFLEKLLNDAKIRRHRQIKINVDLALILQINGRDHYFVVSEPSNLIVDLSSNLNYVLDSDELRGMTKELLLRFKSY